MTAAVQPRAESEDLDAALNRIEGIRIAPTPISGAAISYGFFGDLLKDPRGRIAEIRYYSGTDASARFGAQYGGGVIQLISRNQ